MGSAAAGGAAPGTTGIGSPTIRGSSSGLSLLSPFSNLRCSLRFRATSPLKFFFFLFFNFLIVLIPAAFSSSAFVGSLALCACNNDIRDTSGSNLCVNPLRFGSIATIFDACDCLSLCNSLC